MTRIRFLSAVFVWCALLPAAIWCAQTIEQKQEGGQTDKEAAAESIELLASASKVAAYGHATKSPEALIAAAGMLKCVPPARPLKFELEIDGKVVQEPGTIPSFQDEAESLLLEAKKMAKDDTAVVGMADAVSTRKIARGPLAGRPYGTALSIPLNKVTIISVEITVGPTLIRFTASRPCNLSADLTMNRNDKKIDPKTGKLGKLDIPVFGKLPVFHHTPLDKTLPYLPAGTLHLKIWPDENDPYRKQKNATNAISLIVS